MLETNENKTFCIACARDSLCVFTLGTRCHTSILVTGMMRSCLMFVLVPSATASYANIAAYEPGSNVVQHSLIDLDQKEMETHLAAKDYTKAAAIYNKGGNSGAYARFAVSSLDEVLSKGAVLTQSSSPNAAGYIKKTASSGAATFDVTYTSTCKVGGTSSPITGGCFDPVGELDVGGTKITPTGVQNKYRTLAGFSTAAASKMTGQTVYEQYKKFYKGAEPADQQDGTQYGHYFVSAALQGGGAFQNKGDQARIECAKKGSAYMNV